MSRGWRRDCLPQRPPGSAVVASRRPRKRTSRKTTSYRSQSGPDLPHSLPLSLAPPGPQKAPPPSLPPSVIQIGTGEGKSIVLGLLSIFLALCGYTIDCVCYRHVWQTSACWLLGCGGRWKWESETFTLTFPCANLAPCGGAAAISVSVITRRFATCLRRFASTETSPTPRSAI